MRIKILSAKDYDVKLKCTVHATGKLGFTEATSSRLEFNEESAIKFGLDEEDEETLYLVNSKIKDEDSFSVNKIGDYYSVNAKTLFDNLGFDYTNNIISFDMIEVKSNDFNEGEEVYKLIRKEKPRK
ncbi:MAG: hypothetical protein KH117_05660 [Dysgonomonas sp.]|uniref:hypothetical protein n=1 Tax=Dysgonomonas sp. TaxID=1891233 RepID=UPI00257C14D7|nr:hypothetical protein [Dysgonomonas sp.]MBS7120469.1 hypothetical protein [Dysgonomonas sp.]